MITSNISGVGVACWCYETPPLYVVNLSKFQAAVTTADVATAIEETVGLRPGSVSAAEARSIFDLEVCSLDPGGQKMSKSNGSLRLTA